MKKNLNLLPNALFAQMPAAAFPKYDPELRDPYDIYKQPFNKKNIGKVLLLIEGPSLQETYKKEVSIEIFHLETAENMKGQHLTVTIPANGVSGLSIATKDSYPKIGLLMKLWKGTPYSLVQCLVAIEDQIVLLGFKYTPCMFKAFNFENMEPNTKWEVFYQNNKAFFLPR